MKRLSFLAVSVFLAMGVQAQDLETVAIADQFNVVDSFRGKDLNIGTDSNWGDAEDNVQKGSDALGYNGADVIGGPINYINSWAFNSPESPVKTITSSFNNPDWGSSVAAIPANNRPGATGGSTAVLIGDDGGFNALYFGESDDADYYVEVDFYAWNKSSESSAMYETAGITLRNGRDWNPDDFLPHEDGTTRTSELYSNEYTYCPDRAFGYALYYDYQRQEVSAVKFTTTTLTNLLDRAPESFTLYGDPVAGVTEGWHTLRIEANDNHIVFSLDGTVVADIIDTDNPVPFGRPALYYREGQDASAPAVKTGAQFDNLKAGPTTISKVNNWTLY